MVILCHDDMICAYLDRVVALLTERAFYGIKREKAVFFDRRRTNEKWRTVYEASARKHFWWRRTHKHLESAGVVMNFPGEHGCALPPHLILRNQSPVDYCCDFFVGQRNENFHGCCCRPMADQPQTWRARMDARYPVHTSQWVMFRHLQVLIDMDLPQNNFLLTT